MRVVSTGSVGLTGLAYERATKWVVSFSWYFAQGLCSPAKSEKMEITLEIFIANGRLVSVSHGPQEVVGWNEPAVPYLKSVRFVMCFESRLGST